MPTTYYKVVHPSGEFVTGPDHCPRKYYALDEALQRARTMSAIYEKPIEIKKYPEPYIERRFVYVNR